MGREQRLQNRIATGRFTLPVAIFIAVACWLLNIVMLPDIGNPRGEYPLWSLLYDKFVTAWGSYALSFLAYATIGYFLIGLNNTFAFIRIRASIQTSIFLLVLSVCPGIHKLYAGDVGAIMLLVALYFLFKTYRQSQSAGYLFHSFTFIGIGSLFLPQMMFLAPIFWIGAYSFQSLNLKSFFASLLGWSLPYWFLLGYTYTFGQMEIFRQPFIELVNFRPIGPDLQLWEMATLGYLFLLYLASLVHYMMNEHEENTRTRGYLKLLLFLSFCQFVYVGLQPSLCMQLIPSLLLVSSILTGHLFVLSNGKAANIFFFVMFIGLFALFGFNVWTLLLTH